MLKQAIIFATEVHDGVIRKGDGTPYIFHPMEAAMIASRMTKKEEVIAAAMLHDTVEDCEKIKIENIKDKFGNRVAELVEAVTEDKEKNWTERKQHTIDFLKKTTDDDIKIIALSDKLSNIRAIRLGYDEQGESFWRKFRMKEKEIIGKYYIGIRDSLSDMEGKDPYGEYARLVEEIFENKNIKL